jgi:glycosyltransferase involved in cell wall biosynthesis
MNKRSILVSINYPDAQCGGAQRLARALAADNVRRFMIRGTRDDLDVLMRAPGWGARMRFLSAPVSIARLTRRLLVDVVTIVRIANAADVAVILNLHSLLSWVSVAIRRPIVVIPLYHGENSRDDGGRYSRKFLRIMRRYLLRKACTVVCLSISERRALESEFAALPQVLVVAPPVGFASGDGSEPTTLWKDPSRELRILSVARLATTKRLETVIRAVDKLRRSGVDAEYLMIGEGPLRTELNELISALGLQDVVRMPGVIGDQALRLAYETATTFVSLSAEESFGLAAAEALLLTRVVILSPIEAHRELVGTAPSVCVRFVDSSDIVGLAKVLGAPPPAMGLKLAIPVLSVEMQRFSNDIAAACRMAIQR